MAQESGRIRAIHTITERQQHSLAIQFEIRVRCQERLHHPAVLLGLQAAGAVNQDAARFYELARVFEKVALFLDKACEFFRANAPSKLDPAAHDAGI